MFEDIKKVKEADFRYVTPENEIYFTYSKYWYMIELENGRAAASAEELTYPQLQHFLKEYPETVKGIRAYSQPFAAMPIFKKKEEVKNEQRKLGFIELGRGEYQIKGNLKEVGGLKFSVRNMDKAVVFPDDLDVDGYVQENSFKVSTMGATTLWYESKNKDIPLTIQAEKVIVATEWTTSPEDVAPKTKKAVKKKATKQKAKAIE